MSYQSHLPGLGRVNVNERRQQINSCPSGELLPRSREELAAMNYYDLCRLQRFFPEAYRQTMDFYKGENYE